MAGTRTEHLVHRISQESFFSPWSYLSPIRGDNGNELCDVLVVVEPDVIVFSVKEVSPTLTGKYDVDAERWHRRAVDSSVRQLLGAKRALLNGVQILDASGHQIVTPDKDCIRLKMIAVPFGAQDEFFVKGPATESLIAFSGESFEDLMSELDTISDFTKYLDELWKFTTTHQIISDGGDRGILCKYLLDGRTFRDDGNVVQLLENKWGKIKEDSQYKEKKELDRVSYLWDEVIRNLLDGEIGCQGPLNPQQSALVMSRTTRLTRRLLGAHIQVYFVDGDSSITGPATVREPDKVVFLFETTGTQVALEEECAYLSHRHDGHTVIGILGDTRPNSAAVTSVCVLTPGADNGQPLSGDTMAYLDVRLGSEEVTAVKLREFPPFADIEAVKRDAV